MRSEVDDVDFQAGIVTLRERKRVRGRLTTRNVPMSDELRDALRRWIDGHPGGMHTFCRRTRKRDRLIAEKQPQRFSRDDMTGYFRRALAGTRWEKLRGWHVFRHSFCSNCAAAGVDQRLINGWVGHQTEEMVRRYRHLIPNQEQAEIQRVFTAAP